jgi:hypothetical protein
MSAINARPAIIVLACMSLSGCFSLGNTRLYEDRLGYSRALGDAEKSDTLLNVVRLRYADTPIVPSNVAGHFPATSSSAT